MFTESLFIGWSWFGHGQITQVGLAAAIYQFVVLGKTFVLQRLRTFEAVQSAIETQALGSPGFPPTEREVTKFLREIEQHAPSSAEVSLIRLFNNLPTAVQEEDIHPGNMPGIGENIEAYSQIRHYMRSYRYLKPIEAHIQARAWIWDNLFKAWRGMRAGVFHQGRWHDFIDDSSLSDFDAGVAHLASALHTIEDSFSPAHTKRQDGTWFLEDIYYWPDTVAVDPQRQWPGHEAYDQPNSKPGSLYSSAQITTAAAIFLVLSHLDQDETTFKRNCTTFLNRYFTCTFWW